MFQMAAAPQRCLSSRRRLAVLLFVFAVGQLWNTARAQNRTSNATTDPAEARALNAIFERWGIPATNQWNISGELCSDAAIDSTAIDDTNFNPGIKCDCSFANNSTCHITALKVYALDVEGPIPDELWNLTYLTNLNLAQNYLTGPLPASIGNLVRLQYMTVGINALSGELPSELGLLTDLRSLGFGTNDFSGPLPSELGNLTKLTQIYFDSAGVSGRIPASFARLQSLETVWASDNNLTGQIPDFIGSWSNLIQLRFQGNSFQGRIPPSFSNLIAMNDLRITDISNGSSSLDFLRNMMSLSTLVLRHNNVSGSIPSYFGGRQSLTLLDLSFNNLIGRIPDSIFNNSALIYLFLGNNRLTGTLPSHKSSSLQTIDLSYNELSGGLPSWINAQNLQLNIVSNNFTIDNFDSSALPHGLLCLQRNFPCGRGSHKYSSFAIKCGGPQIRSFDQMVYEMDNETLGPATYYMINTQRWAVSNVGLLSDPGITYYRTPSSPQYTNTFESQLYQTARGSTGSLRYYGLGLENGNYTVRLQFVETTIQGDRTWRSLGRRIFNIYIQGNLVVKDFDIRRQPGGASLGPVMTDFTVHVSENYMEIHLFWAGKGTCCVPTQGIFGPSISAISATSDFVPTVLDSPPSTNNNRTGLIVGIIATVAAASLLSFVVIYYVFRRRKMQKKLQDEELLGIDARPYTFSYGELRAATDDFNPTNKLGEGGFGTVYKGTLGDGRVVAVKQLSMQSHQGKNQFVAEIATISAVQHRNLVKLYGCCIEGDKRLIVYEYLENKSLDQVLFKTGSTSLYLDWATRYDICLGIARGLAYLHEESRIRIVHRDIKASNILLDYDLVPKISDFGLAKLYDDNKTHISTRVAGTIGYLAPEYAMRGHLTEKADAFSFGVVALEIISGRPNSDSSLENDMKYLLEWAWNLHENNKELDLIDPTLRQYNVDEVRQFIGISLLCTQASPALRPAMSRVVAMLSGDIEVAPVTSRPGYLTDWKFNDQTTFVSNTKSSKSNTNISHNDTTTIITADNSPINDATPMLHEIIGDGK